MIKELYVIHGWTYTVSPWDKTIALLKEQGITIKMLHVPGLTEPSKKVWTIEEYAKWADQNIPDGAVALGHCNGGRSLLNLLQDKPQKLKHLILLDAAGVYETPSSKRTLTKKVAKIGAPLKKIKIVRKVFHKLTGTTDYAHAPENMKQTLSNMLESDKKLKIENVTTPTTILWGKADTVTPPAQAEVMHNKIIGSNLKLYENWTHAPYICDPTGLARALTLVLKEID